MAAEHAIANILDLIGMDELHADIATAAEEQPADQGVVLAAGDWTEADLARLHGLAERLQQNPATVTAATALLDRVAEARAAQK